MARKPKASAHAFSVVYLVRHGRTPTTGTSLPGRAPGLHLSDVGLAQANTVAERLAELKKPPVAVYASPLERTRETAAPIAKALGHKVKIERGLLECDFGAWTGSELKALMKLPEWQTVQRWPSGFRFPDGESFVEMAARIFATCQTLAARHPGEAVVAVSHADPIKAAIATAAGTPLDLFQRISIAPCSVSAIAFSTSGPHLLTVNSTASLTDLALS